MLLERVVVPVRERDVPVVWVGAIEGSVGDAE